jgi:hypothetical protein
MPIECNVIQDGYMERQQPIEPGTAHVYRIGYEAGRLIVFAACESEDKGGRVYVIDEEILEEITDNDGTYSGNKLEGYSYETIPAGDTYRFALGEYGEPDFMLLFFHRSLN